MIRKLFQAPVAERLFELGDEYYGLLNELTLWTEKKTNRYPIDPLRDHPSMSMRSEREMVKAKMEEDHQWVPGHRKIKRTHVARDLRSPRRKPTGSNYREAYCGPFGHHSRRTGPPPVAESMKPEVPPLPFGVFPEVPPLPRRTLAEFAQQAADARRDGRVNKAVFTGPTCL
jgi:hypothetical protein